MRGASALREHLRLENRFFENVAELCSDWRVKPAPEFSFSSGAAPYQVDLRLQGAEAVPGSSFIVDVARHSSGNLQVR